MMVELSGFQPLRRQEAAKAPTFGETVESAFALNNEIAAVWNGIGQSNYFPPEDGFDLPKAVLDAGEFESNHLYLGVRSRAEFEERRKQVEHEREMRRIYGSSGWTGMMAGVIAGTLSPTILIPLIGAGRGAIGVGQAFGYSALAAGITEGTLAASQFEPDAGETVTNFAAQTVLGGLLGAAVLRSVSRAEQAAILQKIERDPLEIDLRIQGAAGAQVTQVDPGRLADLTVLGRWLAGIGPVTRGIEQAYFKTGRWATAQFGTGGLVTDAMKRGEAPAAGGSLESLQSIRYAMVAQARRVEDEIYAKHIFEGKEVSFAQTRANVMGVAPPEGKLSRQEFRIEVSRAMRSGDKHVVPEVEAYAKYLRKEIYEPLQKELVELKVIPENVNLVGAESYLNRMYNSQAVAARWGEFVEVVSKHVAKRLRESAVAKVEKEELKIAKSEQAVKDLSTSEEEARLLRDQLGESLKVLEASKEAEIADEISFYRALAREMERAGKARRSEMEEANRAAGSPQLRLESVKPFDEFWANATPAELRQLAKDLELSGGDRLQDFYEARVELKRRLSNLSKSEGAVAGAQRRALKKLERTEELNIKGLMRLVRKINKLNEKLARVSDDKLDAEIEKVKKLLRETDALFTANARRVLALEEQLPEMGGLPISGDVILTKKQLDLLNEELPQQLAFTRTARKENKFRVDIPDGQHRDALLAAIDAVSAREGTTRQMRQSLNDLRMVIASIELGDAADANALFARFMTAEEQLGRRLARIEELEERLANREAIPREAIRAELRSLGEEALQKVNRINSARAVRADKLRKKIENYPEKAKAAIKQHTDKIDAARLRMRTATEKAEATPNDPYDFSAFAREIAIHYANKIKGQPFVIPGLDTIPGLRNSELARVIDVPDRELEPFLENDIDLVSTNYVRSIGTDLELIRRFGSVRMEDQFQAIRDEATQAREMAAKGFRLDAGRTIRGSGNWVQIKAKDEAELAKKIEKEQLRITKTENQVLRDLEVLLSRYRHQRGIPADPDGLMYRLAKTTMDLNALRLMGTVVVSSVPDVAMPVLKFGFGRVFRDGLWPVINNWKAFKLTQREAQYAGTANDVVMNTRAQAITDIMAEYRRGTGLERGINFLAHRVGNMPALFNHWTSAMKSVTAGVVNGKIMDSLEVVMEGRAIRGLTPEKASAFLAESGIDGNLASRIWKEKLAGNIVDVDGRWLPNTEDWTDAEAIRAYRSALVYNVDRTIITPGLERPSFVDANTLARVVMQFRSFALSSTTRMLMAGLQQRDLNAASGMAMALGFGALSYYLWAVSVGGQAYDEMQKADYDKWLDEAITRSGLLGVFGEVQKIAEQVPLTQPYATFSGKATTRRQSEDVFGAVLGPSYDFAKRGINVLQGIDSPTQSTLTQASKLLPYQNVFYLRQILEKLRTEAGEAAGLPERRTPE